MDEQNFFTAITQGEADPVTYRLLFSVEMAETDTRYVVYTDNSLTETGETRVYASIYEPDGDSGFLLPIENDWEWDLIEELLTERQQG